MANYKISVLGEVARPGSFTIGNEKVNVLEALAMAEEEGFEYPGVDGIGHVLSREPFNRCLLYTSWLSR